MNGVFAAIKTATFILPHLCLKMDYIHYYNKLTCFGGEIYGDGSDGVIGRITIELCDQ
jgi:hypothetical protein